MSGDSAKPDPKTSPEAAERVDGGKAAPGEAGAGAPDSGPKGAAAEGKGGTAGAAPASATSKPVVKKTKQKKTVRKAKRSVKKKATPKKRAAAKSADKQPAMTADLAQRPLDMPKLEAPLAPDLADRPEVRPAPHGRARWLFATLVLVLAIGAAVYWTQQAPLEPPEPGPAPEPQTAAAPDSERVMEIETLLQRLDFDPGAIDGVADNQTREAISLFQEFAGLPINGEPSEELLGELREVASIMAGNG